MVRLPFGRRKTDPGTRGVDCYEGWAAGATRKSMSRADWAQLFCPFVMVVRRKFRSSSFARHRNSVLSLSASAPARTVQKLTPSMSSRIITLPNVLTVFRMALIPVFVSLLFYQKFLLALTVFIIAGIT